MITSVRQESIFIVNGLKEIAESFKTNVQIKYGYENDTDFHVIEIKPESIRHENKDYMNAETNLIESFHKNFKNNNILICTPKDKSYLTKILYSNIR